MTTGPLLCGALSILVLEPSTCSSRVGSLGQPTHPVTNPGSGAWLEWICYRVLLPHDEPYFLVAWWHGHRASPPPLCSTVPSPPAPGLLRNKSRYPPIVGEFQPLPHAAQSLLETAMQCGAQLFAPGLLNNLVLHPYPSVCCRAYSPSPCLWESSSI